MNKRLVSSTLLTIMILTVMAPIAALARPSEENRVIVGFNNFQSEQIIRSNGWKVNYEYTTIPAVACWIPAQAIEGLSHNPNVAYIEQDNVVALDDPVPDAEMTAAWGVMKIGADYVQASGNLGEGIKVAVIDTGINYLHEDLDGNYKGGYNFIAKNNDPMDDNGHGTHCAGIIAAEDNGIGVIGVAPKAYLYALKVLNAQGSGYVSDIIAAIQWATTTNHMDVISMSLGSTLGSTSLQQACDAAFNSGIVVVAAAGNNGAARTGSNIIYPARYANVIAVGATDSNNVRASFSCTGPELDVVAPGVNILSDYLDVKAGDGGNVDTLYMSGTSMATPHVAGTAALILKSDEKAWQPYGYTNGDGAWTAQEVTNVLINTADDLGTTGKDNYYGYGIVDADQAAMTPPPPPPKPLTATYEPTAVTTTMGIITGGSVASLSANDAADLTVKSTKQNTYQRTDWYSSATITQQKAQVTKLDITYDGSNTRTATQTLYVYNWATSTWQSINSQNVGTNDKTVIWSTSNPENYISNSGEIQLRCYATLRTTTSFNCNADYTTFAVTYTT